MTDIFSASIASEWSSKPRTPPRPGPGIAMIDYRDNAKLYADVAGGGLLPSRPTR
jgi:hypothetical protein